MTTISHNFLPQQYNDTNPIKINHNYLRNQFADYAEVFKRLEVLLLDGDFTLGKAVDEFENRIKEICGHLLIPHIFKSARVMRR